MKKIILVQLPMVFALLSNAQQLPLGVKPELQNQSTRERVNDGTEVFPQNHSGTATQHPKAQSQDFSDIVLGSTRYDLQSNSSLGNRFIRSANGEMNVVWTTSNQIDFSDRGAAYAHNYSGAWDEIPVTTRIESKRTGWPGIARTASDKEVVLVHNTSDSKLQLTSRTPSGSGNWSEDLSSLPSPIADGNYWPRLVSGGSDGNSLHAISVTSPVASGGTILNNQNGALCYSRSTNGGTSWDKVNIVLPEVNGTQYGGFSADDYALDAKGNVIAFVAGGNWNDLILMKSTDNGDTWTKTTVFANPLPQPHRAWQMNSDANGDNVADSIYTNSGSMAILIDNNNNCHVFFDFVRALDIGVNADSSSYFPYVGAQLYHWKEGMATYTQLSPEDGTAEGVIAWPVDNNDNDTLDFMGTPPTGSQFPFGLYNGVGLVGHPSAGIGADGTIYLTYSAYYEPDITSALERAYRHTYIISSVDDGDTWSPPFDIFTDEFTESVFGNMVRGVDDSIRVVYQRDGSPGHGQNDVNPDPGNDGTSDIVYVAVPKTSVGVNDINLNISGMNVYPNPATQNTKVSFASDIAGDLTLNVYNITGELMNTYGKRIQPGITYLNLNTADYAPGIYLINLQAGKQLISKKLIVQ